MAQYDSSTTSTSNRNSRPFKDIDLDFGRNTVTNDVMTVTDIVAIKRSVKNLIQTNFYERPFHPEMGCGVRELLFENFEPRVTLNSVHLDDDPDNNRLVVDIYFYVTGIPGPQQVSTFLQRLR